MASFQFKFETVLRHRQLVEDECQRELAKHLRGRMIFQDELRRLQGTIRDAKHQLGDHLVGKVDLDRVSGFARYSGHVTVRAQQLVQRVQQLEKHIDAARARLLDATRQRKALELLRDEHRAQWQAEQQRRETIELDELATQRYIRDVLMEQTR